MGEIISITMWSDLMRIVTSKKEKIYIKRDGKEIKVTTENGSENIEAGIIEKLEALGVNMKEWQKDVIFVYAYK